MEMAISVCLCSGTQQYLDGNYENARDMATFAKFFEQHIAVEVKQTEALLNWPKITDTHHADLHTLVKILPASHPLLLLEQEI